MVHTQSHKLNLLEKVKAAFQLWLVNLFYCNFLFQILIDTFVYSRLWALPELKVRQLIVKVFNLVAATCTYECSMPFLAAFKFREPHFNDPISSANIELNSVDAAILRLVCKEFNRRIQGKTHNLGSLDDNHLRVFNLVFVLVKVQLVTSKYAPSVFEIPHFGQEERRSANPQNCWTKTSHEVVGDLRSVITFNLKP
jgi:hypothetical protein